MGKRVSDARPSAKRDEVSRTSLRRLLSDRFPTCSMPATTSEICPLLLLCGKEGSITGIETARFQEIEPIAEDRVGLSVARNPSDLGTESRARYSQRRDRSLTDASAVSDSFENLDRISLDSLSSQGAYPHRRGRWEFASRVSPQRRLARESDARPTPASGSSHVTDEIHVSLRTAFPGTAATLRAVSLRSRVERIPGARYWGSFPFSLSARAW